MGWRGTIRTLAAASRRIERQHRQRQAYLAKRQQQFEKMAAAERAAHEVEQYENSLDVLLSVHKECAPLWNWIELRSSNGPVKPVYSDERERSQRRAEEGHKPNFLDRLLNRVGRKLAASEAAIESARQADQRNHEAALVGYAKEVDEWKQLQATAAGVLAGDVASFRAVLEEVRPLANLDEIGSSVRLNWTNAPMDRGRVPSSRLRRYSQGHEVPPQECPRVRETAVANKTE